MSGFDLTEYTDVKTKIDMFIKAFPEGSLQFEYRGVCDHNPDMIWGIAYAYRTADDQRPGMGMAQELKIGKTPFTRGSELQNLETSCWGRAISALGIGIAAGIASAEEVVLAKARQPVTDAPRATQKQIDLIRKSLTDDEVKEWKESHGYEGPLSKVQAMELIDQLMKKDQ